MTAVPDLPIPPELALPDGAEPFSDYDLGNYLAGNDEWTSSGLITFRDDGTVETAASPLVRTERVGVWRIEADDQAEWAGRKLAEAAEEVARLQEQANEWAARIGHWFEQASKRPRQSADFFEGHLEDYAMRIRAAGGPSSLVLPSVTVGTTLHKPAVKVEDDDLAATYLTQIPSTPEAREQWDRAWAAVDFEPDDLIQIKPKVYVVPLRKLVHVEEVEEPLWDWEAISECGHKWEGEDPVGQPDDFLIPDRGEMITCHDCGQQVAVAAVVTRQRKRLAAVGPDGVEVPGCTVSEASVTATVEVR